MSYLWEFFAAITVNPKAAKDTTFFCSVYQLLKQNIQLNMYFSLPEEIFHLFLCEPYWKWNLPIFFPNVDLEMNFERPKGKQLDKHVVLGLLIL